MFEWRVNLDDDAVYDLLTTLEKAVVYHGDSAVGREHKRIADELRNSYACWLTTHAEEVRNKWAKGVE